MRLEIESFHKKISWDKSHVFKRKFFLGERFSYHHVVSVKLSNNSSHWFDISSLFIFPILIASRSFDFSLKEKSSWYDIPGVLDPASRRNSTVEDFKTSRAAERVLLLPLLRGGSASSSVSSSEVLGRHRRIKSWITAESGAFVFEGRPS